MRRQVEAMASYGVPEADIAGVIGIDPKTLRKHYRAELDHGHVKANMRVAENLYRKATGEGREAVVAAIFWLKTRAGWRETNVHEIGGSRGAPVAVEVVQGASDEFIRRINEIAERQRQVSALTGPTEENDGDRSR
jgi:hypothetical protein